MWIEYCKPAFWVCVLGGKKHYLQKHCHFRLVHELDPRLHQLRYILQVVRILPDQGSDVLQFLLLSSGDGLGHFGLPLLQDAVQVVELLTQVLFLLPAAFLLVESAGVRNGV